MPKASLDRCGGFMGIEAFMPITESLRWEATKTHYHSASNHVGWGCPVDAHKRSPQVFLNHGRSAFNSSSVVATLVLFLLSNFQIFFEISKTFLTFTSKYLFCVYFEECSWNLTIFPNYGTQIKRVSTDLHFLLWL